MYGQAPNPLAGIAQLGTQLTSIAMSPLQRWQQASFTHKIVAVGAGAGLAYYLHKKGMADIAVAGAGLAAAYGTSMVMHYPAVSQGVPAMPAANAAVPALPAPNVDGMAHYARQALGGGALPAPQPAAQGGGVVTRSAPAPSPMGAMPAPRRNDPSKWDGLG
jgi:hypothetical protein